MGLLELVEPDWGRRLLLVLVPDLLFLTLQWGVRNLSFHVQLSTSPPHPSDNCYSNGAVCVWFSLTPLSLLDLSSLWQQVFLLIVVGTAYKGEKEESKQSCWAFQSSVHTVCGFERTISCYFRWRWCLNSVLYHGVGCRRYSFLSDFTSLFPLPLVFLGRDVTSGWRLF